MVKLPFISRLFKDALYMVVTPSFSVMVYDARWPLLLYSGYTVVFWFMGSEMSISDVISVLISSISL